MNLKDFDFELPPELIAQFPVSPRDSSRLLHLGKKTGALQHKKFSDLIDLLKSEDLLVFNDTKVLPARLFAKTPKRTDIEVLLLQPTEIPGRWSCLVRPGRKVNPWLPISFADGSEGKLTREGDKFFVEAPPLMDPNLSEAWLEKNGVMPLPPYLGREATEKDRETYQTVYAASSGSIAAPTAGLHFTPELLRKLQSKGIQQTMLTLHVGYGTFAPINSENLEDHVMHEESYEISAQTLEMIKNCKERGGRVISVGTTTLRALESVATHGRCGKTKIFIKPGDTFTLVDGLITNFHLPQSTLLVLVSAFAGQQSVLNAYRTAVKERYRFFSYGDAMLIS